jgi:CubicO group peptidase (beta-lactamase class C family)
MHRRDFLVQVVSVTAGLVAARAAQGLEAEPQINQVLEPLRTRYDLPALAAAVVNGKGLIAIGAVGVRKRGDDTPVTVNDQFHLGSDTKAMTATLIAHLVEQGKLDWSDTLGKLFPADADALTPELRTVTLTQLLSHHAGLPKNLPGGWNAVAGKGTFREQRHASLLKLAKEKLEAEPGSKYFYSNLGYVLAAHMAEQAGDASWEELLARHVFEPLGMKSAGFGPAGTPGKIDQPLGHTEKGEPIDPPRGDNPQVMGPAGTVHCSLPDWAKFVADQLRQGRGDRSLLRPEMYQRLHRPAFPESADYSVGGWNVLLKSPRTGGLALIHDGSNNKNHSTAWLAPPNDLAILVVTNQGNEAADKACHEAVELLGKKHLIER